MTESTIFHKIKRKYFTFNFTGDTRRSFLWLVVGLLLFIPVWVQAVELKHDGYLRLFHSHSGEFLDILYERGGILIPEAMQKINHLLRSRGDQTIHPINTDLIVLIDHLQDHFGADTVEIICGYRSPKFNGELYQAGHNVAKESYHLNGIAADIHIDEIPEEEIVRYLRTLNLGGVGYYPDLLMVHADLGLKRFWQENKFTNRTNIGIFNPDSPLILKTDRLFYLDKQEQSLVVKGADNNSIKSMQLEYFHRSEFKTLLQAENIFLQSDKIKMKLIALPASKEATIDLAQNMKILSIPYGKFRWKVLTQSGSEQYSNEFYFKRLK